MIDYDDDDMPRISSLPWPDLYIPGYILTSIILSEKDPDAAIDAIAESLSDNVPEGLRLTRGMASNHKADKAVRFYTDKGAEAVLRYLPRDLFMTFWLAKKGV